MPTFNQLVRKGRQVSEKKAKAPALLKGWNSKKRVAIDQSSPQKRGVRTGYGRAGKNYGSGQEPDPPIRLYRRRNTH